MRPWTIDRDDDGQPIRLLWTGSVRLIVQKAHEDKTLARGDRRGESERFGTALQFKLFSTFGENEK